MTSRLLPYRRMEPQRPLCLLGVLAMLAAGTPTVRADVESGGGSAAPVPGSDSAAALGGSERAAAGRRLTFVSGLSISAIGVDVRGTTDGRGDGTGVTTRIEPAVRASLRSGRVQGNLDYTLTAQDISGDAVGGNSETRSIQNALNAQLAADFSDNFRFDAQATVSRQNRSAFGRLATGDSLAAEGNRVEVGSLTFSPSFRLRLGGWAEAQLRLRASGTNARDSIVGDSTIWGGDFVIASPSDRFGLGWSLGASQQTADFRASRETRNERAWARISWRPDIDWELALRGGQERSDVGVLKSQTYNNWGFGVRWTPSARTNFTLDEERRFFGESWTAQFQYRTPRTIWRAASSRSSGNGGESAGSGQALTAYQLLFAQFASRFPDPAERDRQVRDFLRALDIDPDALVAGGAVDGAVTLQQRNDVSVAWNGRRARVLAQAYDSRTRVLDTLGASAAAAADGRISLWGWSVTMGWQLLPGWSVSLTGGRQVARPNEVRFGTDLKSVSLSLNGQIGRQATLGVNGRYAVFNSAQDPYRETSLGASLGLRF
jgi:uncharacterized protein (PEP-CTERM system associated)